MEKVRAASFVNGSRLGLQALVLMLHYATGETTHEIHRQEGAGTANIVRPTLVKITWTRPTGNLSDETDT